MPCFPFTAPPLSFFSRPPVTDLECWESKGARTQGGKAIGNDPLHMGVYERGGGKGREREMEGKAGGADFGTLRKTDLTKPVGGEPHLRAFSCSGPLNTRAPLSPASQTLQPHCLPPPTLEPTRDSSAPI